MAAFLGSARQWELFGRRLRALQRKYGFKTLHAKDFRAQRGEFNGWSIPKCRELAEALANAIRDNLTEGVTSLLPRAPYEADYLAPPFPKGMPRDSQYGLCFRMCLYRLVQIVTADKKRHRLHVVIEDGHKNVNNTLRIFDEVKAEMRKMGHDVLGTITIAKKAECDLLMVADFQAHLISISQGLLKRGQPGYFEIAGDPSLAARNPIKDNEAALTQLEFTPESLRKIKTDWQQDKDDRIAKWREARDARRAAASSSKEQPS